jgi:hypothetical protein
VRGCKTPAAAISGLVGQRRKSPSEESYNKEPRLGGALENRIRAYLGAEESVLVDLLFLDLWLCFLWVEVLAGVSDEAGVSAANTGPAAKANRQTAGMSFLNIERLH